MAFKLVNADPAFAPATPFLDFVLKVDNLPRVLVFGSREWWSYDLIRRDMWMLRERIGDYTLVHGACRSGADWFANEFATMQGWEIEPHPANWTKYGKPAGFIRNSEMAMSEPDYAMGYILDESRGSMNMLGLLEDVPTKVSLMTTKTFHGFPEI